jgi:glycosyltransferase involved in cell wall biosynthesis
MAAAILRLARSEAMHAEFSANAKAAFQSRFSLQTMADAYMELYRDTPRVRRAAIA